MKTIKEITANIELKKCVSTWSKGVKDYALELLEPIGDYNGLDYEILSKIELLNGAMNWNEYSWGGNSFIYNEDIAKRLCTTSEFKKKKSGELKPNSDEEWLDTQARALAQASRLIIRVAKEV